MVRCGCRPGLVRIPDVAFISWGRLPNRRVPTEPIPDLAPDLAVEVLSVGNTPGEMARKRQGLFRCWRALSVAGRSLARVPWRCLQLLTSLQYYTRHTYWTVVQSYQALHCHSKHCSALDRAGELGPLKK